MTDAASVAGAAPRRLPIGLVLGGLLLAALILGGVWYAQAAARDSAEAEARQALTQVADRVLLVANGPHVEVVNMLQPIDATLFQHIGKLYRLSTCKLSDCDVTDDQLAQLTGLSSLLVLQVERCPKVTSQGMVHVAELSSLEKLFADGTSIDDAGLAHLAGLRTLTTLDVSHTKITDAGLAHLTDLPKLEVLRISGAEVTDAGVEHLKAIEPLRLLNVSGTKITPAGKQALQAVNRELKFEETETPQVTEPQPE